MSKLTLWHVQLSPPSWTVRILAEILGLQLDFKEIDFLNEEHKSPAFRKLNVMGTVPVVQDGDFNIAESHAIMKYLLFKYGSKQAQDLLYPSDLRQRALVDQAMFFDTGVAFIRVKNVFLPLVFDGVKEISPKVIESIEEVYSIIEDYLSRHKYIAIDRLTLADLSVGTTTTSLNAIHQIDDERYPLTIAWLNKLNEEPSFKKVAAPGAEASKEFLKMILAKNNAA